MTSKFRFSLILLALSMTLLISFNAFATDLLCHGTYTDQNPTDKNLSAITYRLDVSIAGIGSDLVKMNAALTTTNINHNSGSQLSVSPIASMTAGQNGVSLTRYNSGKSLVDVLWNEEKNWVISGIDETSVKINAGKSALFNIGVRPHSMVRGLPNALEEMTQLFCVAF